MGPYSLTVVRPAKLVVRVQDVDRYIEAAPKNVQPNLRAMRAAIREAAPDAVEGISYGMPFYRFKGESGFRARLCYFGLLKKSVVFYTRPVFLEEHREEVEPYLTTKSALHFPLDKPVPVELVRELVRSGVRRHEAGRDNRLF